MHREAVKAAGLCSVRGAYGAPFKPGVGRPVRGAREPAQSTEPGQPITVERFSLYSGQSPASQAAGRGRVRDDPRNPIHNEDVRLREKRAWLNRHIEKAMRKRHRPLPEDSWPMWRRLAPDAAAVAFTIVYFTAACYFAAWIGEIF